MPTDPTHSEQSPERLRSRRLFFAAAAVLCFVNSVLFAAALLRFNLGLAWSLASMWFFVGVWLLLRLRRNSE